MISAHSGLIVNISFWAAQKRPGNVVRTEAVMVAAHFLDLAN